MPQITDTFLDRLVQLMNIGADQKYRQELTEELENASYQIIPAPESVPVTETQTQELGRRLEAFESDPSAGKSWKKVPRDFSTPSEDFLDAVDHAVSPVTEHPESFCGRSFGASCFTVFPTLEARAVFRASGDARRFGDIFRGRFLLQQRRLPRPREIRPKRGTIKS